MTKLLADIEVTATIPLRIDLTHVLVANVPGEPGKWSPEFVAAVRKEIEESDITSLLDKIAEGTVTVYNLYATDDDKEEWHT